jgi:putative tryptophan/tyrosine transport system substrate-binding protein
MKRRTLIAGLAGAPAWPLAARAQQPAMPVIGFLNDGEPIQRQNAYTASFLAGLAETGYVEGRNFVLEFWLAEDNGRLPAVAANLVRRRVAMIFAASPPAAVAAKSATAAIPIVFVTGSDPVEEGLVASLSRPGGNITGVTLLTQELIGKRIELLHEIVPAATTIGYLLDPTGAITEAQMKDAEAASRPLGVQLAILNTSTPSQIETVFTTLVERRVGALAIGTGTALFFRQREQIASLAARHGTPVIYPWREYVDASGLMSYGPNLAESYRIGGTYAGRILKGEKPSDLPVRRSTRIETVINLKTAKALGLTIPETLLATADEVIQ